MTDIDKFLADCKRHIKRYREESGTGYDGLIASEKIAELFASWRKDLGDVPKSLAEYWVTEYIASSSELQDEPTREHLDWLACLLEFLEGENSSFECFSKKDWETIRDCINYEAEVLPVDILTTLMSILLEKQVL